jgi:hypothetical protein
MTMIMKFAWRRPAHSFRGTALALLSLIVPDTAAEMPGPAKNR